MIKPLGLVVLVALVSIPAAAQQPPPSQTKPDPKTDTKPAPTLPGKWAMVVDTTQGTRQATLTIALDGKKVTGTLASDQGEMPITGEFADNKLTFTGSMSGNGTEIVLGFTGGFKDDGSLAGTLDFGQGAMNWTAQRIKEKE